MKIIIEQKDVGKEFEIGDIIKYFIQAAKIKELQSNMKEPCAIVYDAKSFFGVTPSGAPVTIKKERKKPGPKPKVSSKIKAKPGRPKKKIEEPLPYSSDVNPITGEPYVKRGATIDQPVQIVPMVPKF